MIRNVQITQEEAEVMFLRIHPDLQRNLLIFRIPKTPDILPLTGFLEDESSS